MSPREEDCELESETQERGLSILINALLVVILLFFVGIVAYVVFRLEQIPFLLVAATVGLCTLAIVFYGAILILGSQVWRIRVLLMTLSLGTSLILLEVLVALLGIHKPPNILADRIAQAERLGVSFDKRSRTEVIKSLEESGVRAMPNLTPGIWVDDESFSTFNGKLFPLSGPSQAKVVLCNEAGEYVVIQNDEWGFNNPTGITDPEVVIVGDSFAQGYCVPPGSDVAGYFRERDIPTSSRGMNSIGPLIELAILREYVAPIKPPIVLWFYYEGNDLRDAVRESERPSLLQYLNPDFSQNLIAQQPAIDELLYDFAKMATAREETKEAIDSMRSSFWLRVLRLWHLRRLLKRVRSRSEEAVPEVFYQILERARDDVAAWDGKLYFVYLPSFYRYDRESDDSFLNREAVLEIAAALELPILDFHTILETHSDPLTLFPLQMHGHYNSEGFRMLSEYLYESIEQGKD